VSTATKSQWEGRLGVEVIGKMQGCCVDTIAKWRPGYEGSRRTCSYCDVTMKTVRAGATAEPEFTGMMGEQYVERSAPELVIGGLYFAKAKFPDIQSVASWMEDRDITGRPTEIDMHAHYLPMERLAASTVKAIWVAPGVVGEIGVTEKQASAATGAGQASQHAPSITTASMASGGTANPKQGDPATETMGGVPGFPNLIRGVVDHADGHQHEYHLEAYQSPSGWRVKGFTSYNEAHSHFIDAPLNKDGTFDARTAPDQSPVGGHAHAHRVIWLPGSAVAEKTELPVYQAGEEAPYSVTSQDVVLLRRAAGLVKNFCTALHGGVADAEGNVAKGDGLDMFRQQLDEVLRDRGRVAHSEATLAINKADLERLRECGSFIGSFGERLAAGLGMGQ